MDENTCMVEVARFFMSFTQRESCGKCVPCREGTKRMLEILERIVDGKGKMSDLDELEELATMVQSMAHVSYTHLWKVSTTFPVLEQQAEAYREIPIRMCEPGSGLRSSI